MIRERERKTQQEIAEAVNLNTSSINKYELGQRQPSVRNAKKIAKELNFDKYDYDWTYFFEDLQKKL